MPGFWRISTNGSVGNVTEEQSNFSLQINRYGLPLIILVFYLAASMHFNYTPESTFVSVRSAHLMTAPDADGQMPGDASISPLWCFLIMIASSLGVDVLLAAKVLSLLFACLSILCFHLVVNEIVQDRLVAFIATIPFAAQSWLIQVAPSGSPFLFLFVLILAGLFFMLRNEYLISTCFISLAALVFWQAMGLMVLIIADVYLNSIDPRRAAKMGVAMVLIFTGTLAPWFVFASLRGMSFLSVIPSVEAFTGTAPVDYVIPLLLVFVVALGAVFLWRSGVEGQAKLRALVPLFGATIWFGVVWRVSGVNSVYFGMVYVMILAFFSLWIIAQHKGGRWAYPVVLVFAGLLLIAFQTQYNLRAKEMVNNAISRSEELSSIGYWLRSRVQAGEMVVSEEPASLSYYSGCAVNSSDVVATGLAMYVVASNNPGQYFERVYDPVPLVSVTTGILSNHYAVWKRRQ